VKAFPPNFRLRQPRSHCSPRADWCAIIALGIFALGAPGLHSQAPAEPGAKSVAAPAASSAVKKTAASKVAAIKSFRIVQEKDGQAVEILSTKPLVPSIQALSGPDRLVIDLPNARLETQQKRISVQADQIGTLRADQFQQNPPVTRVVVDLLAPRDYTWDAAGNRLVVHLGKSPGEAQATSPFEPPSVPSLTSAPQPVVAAVRATGPLALAANDGGSGSSITAGVDTAVLNLSTGGEVHVCPGTTVSVTPSQNRHNVMLSMNTGALEAHLALDASSDSVMTPDFRILLVGPGEFHYAISADNQGNTCVRALPGNTASAIVSELLGDRTYQVKVTDQLVFRSGQLDRVDAAVPLECGCPPPRNASLQATNNLPTQSELPSASPTKAQSETLPPVNANPAPGPETVHEPSAPPTGMPTSPPPLDATVAPNELHVQVDAPLVFHATGPPPSPVEDVRALPFDSRPPASLVQAAALPPSDATPKPAGAQTASAKQAPPRGFFRKLGGFFASLFH
jgi:hypothetical protein